MPAFRAAPSSREIGAIAAALASWPSPIVFMKPASSQKPFCMSITISAGLRPSSTIVSSFSRCAGAPEVREAHAAGLLEEELDRHPRGDRARVAALDVADHADALLELDERDDVGDLVGEDRIDRMGRDDPAVDGAAAARLEPAGLRRLALGAHRAGRPAGRAAGLAARHEEAALRAAVPERPGVEVGLDRKSTR